MPSLDACTLNAPVYNHGFGAVSQAATRSKASRLANTLIRQRQEKHTQQAALYRGHAFTHSAFLDPYPIVLAGNENGITVIQVNDAFEGNDSVKRRRRNYVHEPSENSRSDSNRDLCGTVLARHLDSRRDDHSASPQGSSRGIRRIQSVHRGQAFAVGTNDGQFRVFCTETGATKWASQQKDWNKGEIVMQQGLTANAQARWTMWGDNRTSVWQSMFPVRRYDRYSCINNNDPDLLVLTLQGQIKSPTSHQLSRLHELRGVEEHDLYRYNISHRAWDFWDKGTNLLAAHVGGCGDYFGISLYDDRCNGTHHVVVDASATEPLSGCLETICFTSEKMLATLTHNKDPAHREEIKFWDIRQMQRALPSSIILPSFPRDSVLSHEPVYSHTRSHQDNYFFGDMQALPNGDILYCSRPLDISQNVRTMTFINPTGTRAPKCFQPLGGYTSVEPASTNQPTAMFATLADLYNAPCKQRSIVILDIKSLIESAYSNRLSTSGKRTCREANEPADPARGIIALDLKDTYGLASHIDSLAMNESGTMFLCGSRSDESLYIVRGGTGDIF
ncbi:hypothetical protein MPSEU_000160000 [Mayamaea pseudoterrestris]|nr:hypothetical protein MPSEU_000160000 [Mayamaea pseudoterrestris]